MHAVAIILARGGSKGIPRKNLLPFCGQPLLAWTVQQCAAAAGVDSVWVSSDSDEILEVGAHFGARPIVRPPACSGDDATSEAAWRHAVDYLEGQGVPVDVVVAPQVPAPVREPVDVENGLARFRAGACDSLFSASIRDDMLFWRKDAEGRLHSINYDHRNRKRRQDCGHQYIENGSLYMFTPHVLRTFGNRFGDRIACTEMEFWKVFEIDEPEDVPLCEAIMRQFLLNPERRRT